MAHSYNKGDKVKYYHNKTTLYEAKFVCYYESEPRDHYMDGSFDNVVLDREIISDESNPNSNGREFFSISDDKIVPFYENQEVTINYIKAYEVMDGLVHHLSRMDLMVKLGFEVPKDE